MKNLKTGDRVKVTENFSNHTLEIGKVITLDRKTNGTTFHVKDHPVTIQTNEFEGVLETRADIEAEIAKLKALVAEQDTKMVFMNENSLEEYDPQTHKIFLALQVLKGTDSDIDKTVAIKNLIDKK